MLVVSYFTPDYVMHADRLRRSCLEFGLRHWIEPAADLGKWEWNCAAKPAFILRALEACDEPILWLDADAEVRRPIDFPIGIHLAVWRLTKETNHDRRRCRSGTVLVAGEPGLALTRSWVARCQEDPDEWDQAHLWRAYLDHQDSVTPHWLTTSYCQVFDEPSHEGAVPDPHIVHYQASRQRKQRDRHAKHEGAPV